MEATEQTRMIEITESQYNHIQEILKMNKPSRTRLTNTEKNHIKYICEWWLGNFSELDKDEVDSLKSIIKKLM